MVTAKNVLLFPFQLMLQLVRCWAVFYLFYMLLGTVVSILNDENVVANMAVALLKPGPISFLQIVTMLCSPIIVWPRFPMVAPVALLLWSAFAGLFLTQCVWFVHGFWAQELGLSQFFVEFIRFGDAELNSEVLLHFAASVCAGAVAASAYLVLGSFLHWYYSGFRWVMQPVLALFLGWKSAKDYFDPAAGLEPFGN
jgi:hypothetical protein